MSKAQVHCTQGNAAYLRQTGDEDEVFYLGSGDERARKLIEKEDGSSSSKILSALRTICKDEHDDVGGYIQYGKFEDRNFVLLGIQDYEIDGNDNIQYLYTYRGILRYTGDFKIDESELQLRMRYVTPFEKEINAYFLRQELKK